MNKGSEFHTRPLCTKCVHTWCDGTYWKYPASCPIAQLSKVRVCCFQPKQCNIWMYLVSCCVCSSGSKFVELWFQKWKIKTCGLYTTWQKLCKKCMLSCTSSLVIPNFKVVVLGLSFQFSELKSLFLLPIKNVSFNIHSLAIQLPGTHQHERYTFVE